MTAARSFDGAGVRLAGQAGRLALAPHRLAGEGAAQEPAAQAIRGHAHIGSAIEGDWSEPARTSLSHPLRIDEVSAGPGNGCIGLCICPGKCGASLMGQRWQRDLALDLDVVQRWRPDAVVTLEIAENVRIKVNRGAVAGSAADADKQAPAKAGG